ncbi:transporter [hydrocarbon metagenome]|uniref:Transporter n=1 Tax=hydrocarbon metagenome TaxID=938273 RepID=A0A0W8F0F4_9ZZZZ
MTAINNLLTTGHFFIVIAAELVLLFIGISFLVGLIQEYVPEEKIRRALTTRHTVTGTALGAVFGALTPFCSCSTIPILMGLIRSKVPFGACMAFLFASPLLNPIIIFMILAFFGLVPTLIYFTMTFCIAVFSGIVLERRKFLRYVKPIGTGKGQGTGSPLSSGCSCTNAPTPVVSSSCCSGSPIAQPEPASSGCSCNAAPAPVSGCCSKDIDSASLHRSHIYSALHSALALFRQVLPYLILGAAIGAFIYGFIPEDLIVALAGPGNPLAIPFAAIIGIPMYIRAETIIPISAVLLTKGMGIGAVMALIIGGAGASIPEVTLLASLFEKKLVAAFVATILGVAILTGGLFQILQVTGMVA